MRLMGGGRSAAQIRRDDFSQPRRLCDAFLAGHPVRLTAYRIDDACTVSDTVNARYSLDPVAGVHDDLTFGR